MENIFEGIAAPPAPGLYLFREEDAPFLPIIRRPQRPVDSADEASDDEASADEASADEARADEINEEEPIDEPIDEPNNPVNNQENHVAIDRVNNDQDNLPVLHGVDGKFFFNYNFNCFYQLLFSLTTIDSSLKKLNNLILQIKQLLN